MPESAIRASALLPAVAVALGILFGLGSPQALADSVYPDITQYFSDRSLAKYRAINREGIWFRTGVGLICAIGDDGSFGCSGKVPGAPAGENEVGWFPGDPFPRLYRTEDPKFDSGEAQTVMGGRKTISYHGSTCAVTADQGAYCINGDNLDSQLLVASEMTYRGRNAQPTS